MDSRGGAAQDHHLPSVIPAKAGIQFSFDSRRLPVPEERLVWMPAFAGIHTSGLGPSSRQGALGEVSRP